jgi:hypothetical protein
MVPLEVLVRVRTRIHSFMYFPETIQVQLALKGRKLLICAQTLVS